MFINGGLKAVRRRLVTDPIIWNLGQENEDDTRAATTSPNNHSKRRTLSLDRFNVYQLLYTANLQCDEAHFWLNGYVNKAAAFGVKLIHKYTFGGRLISRFGPVNWPPRSCDLTPLYYFLWGYLKSLVYADKPQTLDHFEDNIRRVIADIRPQMLEKVIENWTSRLDYIRASRGSPMP
ncbi:uncharacterized protein TNCV_2704971 [Trichonephila clavipes]|nr:uncharacterized protein TNCV_2704971 [Trichonephila clavipes]